MNDTSLHRIFANQENLERILDNLQDGIIAHDLDGRLDYRLGNDRVDLAGHDGRAGLQRREVDFPQPAPGTGCQPPDVIGDF